MSDYIVTDSGGRITGWTFDEKYATGFTEVEDLPDDFHDHPLGDWLYIDGTFTNDGAATQAAQEAAEQAAKKEQERNTLEAESKAFFVDDGKSEMQAQIEAGGNPQLISLAKMQVSTMSFESETQIASVNTLLPDWIEDGHEYKQGDAFQWDGRTWRVSQDTTSQSIYPPDVSESLYYEIVIAPDGIIVYRPARGKYDSVRLGELRHYPDADGSVYKSLVDWNAYDPDTVPANWELVSEE